MRGGSVPICHAHELRHAAAALLLMLVCGKQPVYRHGSQQRRAYQQAHVAPVMLCRHDAANALCGALCCATRGVVCAKLCHCHAAFHSPFLSSTIRHFSLRQLIFADTFFAFAEISAFAADDFRFRQL
jgi:hypothetical protein